MRPFVLVAVLFACSNGGTRSNAPAPVPINSVPPATKEDPLAAKGRALIDLVATGKHDEVVKSFDATMSAALPAAKLAEAWTAIQQQAGTFQAIEAASVKRTPKVSTVLVTCKFERSRLDAKLAFDADQKVTGLFFVPTYEDPPYVDRGKFTERELTIGSPEWALPATLSIPNGAGPFRAVVLVHGSGPHDRDETIGPNRPFKDLAGGLATRGIAVLRYEKRTKVHVAKLVAMPDATVDHEVVDDAIAAVDALRAMREIDAAHIVVAGHSLGGQLAPRIGARSKHVAAIAILAGSTRPMVDAMLEQLEYIASVDPRQAPAIPAIIEQTKAAGARIRELQSGAAPRPGELVLGAGAAYWIDFGKYDAPATAKAFDRPIFVAQGGRDYQVTKVDYAAWQAALSSRKNVAFRHYPELNHVLAAGQGKSSPQEYEARMPVDVRLIDDLAAWVRAL